MRTLRITTIIFSISVAATCIHAHVGGWHEQRHQPTFRRPVEILTDIINDLGVKVLQEYGEIANAGNIAFSPTGIGFVLAALYEGSAGSGNRQISRVLGLPRDRDVTRIGLRDIHRRLRSYLSPDGFLGGLTLNRENTRLRQEYEDVLKFLGFDLSSGDDGANSSVPQTTSDDSSASSGSETTTSGSTEDTGSTDAEEAVTLTTTGTTTAESKEASTTLQPMTTTWSTEATNTKVTTTTEASAFDEIPKTTTSLESSSAATVENMQMPETFSSTTPTSEPASSGNGNNEFEATDMPMTTSKSIDPTTTPKLEETTEVEQSSRDNPEELMTDVEVSTMRVGSPERDGSTTIAPATVTLNVEERIAVEEATTRSPEDSPVGVDISTTTPRTVEIERSTTITAETTTLTREETTTRPQILAGDPEESIPNATTTPKSSEVGGSTTIMPVRTEETITTQQTLAGDPEESTPTATTTLKSSEVEGSTTITPVRTEETITTQQTLAGDPEESTPTATTTLKSSEVGGSTTITPVRTEETITTQQTLAGDPEESTPTATTTLKSSEVEGSTTVATMGPEETTTTPQNSNENAQESMMNDTVLTTTLTSTDIQSGTPVAPMTSTLRPPETTVPPEIPADNAGEPLSSVATLATTSTSTEMKIDTTMPPVTTTQKPEEAATTQEIRGSPEESISTTNMETTTLNSRDNSDASSPRATESETTTVLIPEETAGTQMPEINEAPTTPRSESAMQTRRRRWTSPTVKDPVVRTLLAARSLTDEGKTRRHRSPGGYFSNYPYLPNFPSFPVHQSFPDYDASWSHKAPGWNPPSTLGEVSRDSTELNFLVNGAEPTSVSAATYTVVLPFAFLPSLEALALEFPLDDPRYNILLLLPTDVDGTRRLAGALRKVSLREVRMELQPAWVRAMIPSFMLKGFVTLTGLLQRLGIRDVFEPRVADLSPMTCDVGVYARDVQQSIGVNIRNYMRPDRTHSRNGLFERAGPVSFVAEHPFLFFIIDAETGVSLIAGRIDDPLNSRIL